MEHDSHEPHGLCNLIDSAELENSEIFDLLGEGVFTISSNGSVRANRSFLDQLGFSRRNVTLNQILGKFANSPDTQPREKLKQLLEGWKSGEVTLSLPSKSNGLMRVSVTIATEQGSGGNVLAGLVKTLSSETNPEQGEADWLLNAVFEGIEDGILILNPESLVIERTNPAAPRIFEISSAELVGKSVVDLLAEPDRGPGIAETIRSKLPFFPSVHFDLEMRRSNGVYFPALHGINVIRSSTGEIRAWMWIVSDMTQRVFLNRAISNLETRYRILFDRTADPTLIIDAESRKIIDANSAAEHQLGYKRAELIGLTMGDITPVNRHDDMEKEYLSLNIGETAMIEGLNLTKAGVEVHVQISVVAIDFEGRKVLIASCRDVSQQRLVQLEKLRIEKLDAVRKVAGALAHEFSQPLQGLVTIVELLAKDEVGREEKERLLQKIPPSVERMTMLLDQMKRIVRLETKPYTGADDIVDFHHSSKV